MARYAYFIGYRRPDTAEEAARIRHFLQTCVGADRVFKDKHLLTADGGHVAAARDALEETAIYLALVGRSWTRDLGDDRCDHHMTSEIEIALTLPGVTILPVLVGGADMPAAGEVPAKLAAFTALKPFALRPDPLFRADMEKLWAQTRAVVEANVSMPSPAPASGDFVFVSHSTKDGAVFANEIASVLESHGLKCWIAPRDIKPGRPYPGQIVRAIDQSRGLVLVLTPQANESKDVLSEVQRAWVSGKPIAPVIVADTSPSADLSYFIKVLQSVPWSDAGTIAPHLARTFQAE